MIIKKITSQHRRDFWADMECEFCGAPERDVAGYDDDHYHQHVIPERKCASCGKSTKSEGAPVQAFTPKYPAGMEV